MNKYELELNDENIKATFEEDLLNNNEKILQLCDLISSINCNMTICIDGDWGCGKTFFINHLLYLIKNIEKIQKIDFKEKQRDNIQKIKENNVIVYYDAWKNDNHDNAFDSIIYCLLKEFSNFGVEENIDNIKDILKDIFKNSIKSASFQIINLDSIPTYKDLVSHIYTQEEKKEKFKKLIKKILGEKRLILVIDELDRCNPKFATDLLETIKHFYDLDNITILISTNNNELSNIVKNMYGENFNAYGYLSRFYDFIIRLDNKKNIEYSQKKLKFKSSLWIPHNVAYEMFKKYSFTYRDCNKYRTMYDVVEINIESDKNKTVNSIENAVMFEIVLPIVIAYRIKDLTAYDEFLNNDYSTIRKDINYINQNFNENDDTKGWIKEILHLNLTEIVDGKIKNRDINEVDECISIINKFMKRNGNYYKNLFLNSIKMNLYS